MNNKINDNQNKEQIPYKIQDAMKVTDDIFKLSKDKDYHPGAFIHGLIFALEAVQQSYKIPQQQIAEKLNISQTSVWRYLKTIRVKIAEAISQHDQITIKIID